MKRLLAMTLFVALLLPELSRTDALADTDQNLSLLDSGHTGTEGEPSVSINPSDPNHIAIAAQDDNLNLIALYVSTNGGSSFNLISIGPSIDGRAGTRGDPSVVIGPDSTIYVAYINSPVDFPRKVLVVKIPDSRSSSSPSTATVVDSVLTVKLDKAYLALGPNSSNTGYNIYVTYTIEDDALYMATSTDHGASFTRHSVIASNGFTEIFSMPIVAANGTVYVSWLHAPSAGICEVRLKSSTNAGSTFGSLRGVGTSLVQTNALTKLPATPAKGVFAAPSIAVDNTTGSESYSHPGRLYLCYVNRIGTITTQDSLDTDIVLQHSDDGGVTWSIPRMVHRTSVASQFHPWVAVDQSTGLVAVTWCDTRRDTTGLITGVRLQWVSSNCVYEETEQWVACSTDGGVNWSEECLSDAASDVSSQGGSGNALDYLEYNGIAVANGVLHAAWGSNHGVFTSYTDTWYDKLDVNDVLTHGSWDVPGDFGSVQEAIDASEGGDEILVSGSVSGSFFMCSHVAVNSDSATIDASAESGYAISFPMAYSGGGLRGFSIVSADEGGIFMEVKGSPMASSIRIAQCRIEGSSGGSGMAFDEAASSEVNSAGNISTIHIDTCEVVGGHIGINLESAMSLVPLIGIIGTTITESTAYGILLAGVPGRVRHSSISPAGGVGLGAQDLDHGNIAIAHCTIMGGEIGCEVLSALATLDTCTISGQSEHGIRVLDENPVASLHNKISWCQIREEGSEGGDPKCGVFIEGARNAIAIPTQLLESNTIVGWDVGIRLVEIEEVEECEPCPDDAIGCFPICFDIGSPEILINASLVAELTRNMVVGARDFGIDYAGTNYVTLQCNNAWIPGTIANSYRPSTVPSGNSRQPPLFCENRDDFVAEWTLRIDSPGAPGNSPCGELIGALPVECAWDTLARSTTVASGTSFRILEDVIIPTGKSLILEHGVTARFDTLDNSERGLDHDKNELTVLGTLDVNGTSGSPVTFESTEATPTENQHWWGINAPNSGIANLDYAAVNSSDWGFVFSSVAASVVENSTFSDNNLTDIKSGSASPLLTIRDNTLTVGGGIGMDLALADSVIDNNVYGDGSTVTGIRYSSSNDSTATGIARNNVEGVTTGTGIELGPGSSVLARNTVTEGLVGVKVTGGTHHVGTTDQQSDNIIDGATTALQVIRGGPSCPASGALDLVVKNNQFFNYTDGLATVKAPRNSIALIDAGISVSGSNQGLNQFANDDSAGFGETIRAIVAGTSACDSLYARANFFGQYAGSIEGEVDTTGTLTTQPASAFFETEPVPPKAPSVRMLGAYPNPTSGHIRFDLEVSSDRIDAEVQIVDVLGRLVRKITATGLASGVNHIEWDGTDQQASKVSNGIYFVRIQHAGDVVATIRIVMAR